MNKQNTSLKLNEANPQLKDNKGKTISKMSKLAVNKTVVKRSKIPAKSQKQQYGIQKLIVAQNQQKVKSQKSC